MGKILTAIILAVLSLTQVWPGFAQDSDTHIHRAKLAEIYTTVSVIENAQEAFFLEKGCYASKHDDSRRPFYNLCRTDNESCRQLFDRILGVSIPDGPFAYEVVGVPARIVVYVKENIVVGALCYKIIEGAQKGEWFINKKHPWKDSVAIEGAQFYE